jgi:hypothetical protein
MWARRRDFSALRPVILVTCAVTLGGTATATQEQTVRIRRPFDHERHERVVSCRQCHGTGSGHGQILVKTGRDCAACHHGGNIQRTCTDCHRVDSIPAPERIASTLSLSVWSSGRTRMLPFRHSLHASLTCTDCHRTAVTLARDRECASCHTSHHNPRAVCSGCHSPPPQSIHPIGVHLSCAGSSCHSPVRAPAPAFSRTQCLFCHPAQTAHEPGGNCAECHKIGVGAGQTREPAHASASLAGRR